MTTNTSIIRFLKERNITEVRHFTTNKGLAGTLATETLLSRRQLPEELYLEHVFTPNCNIRKDVSYTDYISLSITQINAQFFNVCSGSWHAGSGVWWVVLGFDAHILADPGVIFATTNNMYSGVRREGGLTGISDLYSDEVRQYLNRKVRRQGHADNQPTDPQGEALYPQRLSTQWLRCVYVRHPEHEEKVAAMMDAVGHHPVEIKYDPEAFK